ncbi:MULTISPECIES: CRISPR-associated endoribonuclease Cas6 [unclassified Thermosipho (in: thermotogales)]|uniref:CRISPR-associated endoribonuclease Cas6 n=1 Tax=unclassified Thermosipho (in: thermotogales) TaxID=2676525 RepID=UPI002100A0E6|nr:MULTISPECIES: CRISPR-associated endoribonuclease Cas6 [unclassified Thermosipho (in: thermotogales)]
MFYSLVFKLKALNSGIIHTYPGEKIHGMFFSILKMNNSELAKKLHDNIGHKPFTVSSFLGKKVDKPLVIEKEKSYYIRMTFLEDNVFNSIAINMFKNKFDKKKLDIDNIKFLVTKLYFHEKQSKWTGITTEEELFKIDNVKNEIKLRFYTPTLLKVENDCLYYPKPEKVFGDLLKKFNRVSSKKIKEEIIKDFNEIKISNMKIYKKKVYMSNYYLKGFVGDVVFSVDRNNNTLAKIVNLLSKFAFFSGVGYKTAMGLGQVKDLKEDT